MSGRTSVRSLMGGAVGKGNGKGNGNEDPSTSLVGGGNGKGKGNETSSTPHKSGQSSSKALNPEITFGVEIEFVLCIKKSAVPQDTAQEYFAWATSRLNNQSALRNNVLNSFTLGRSIQYGAWNLITDSSISGRPDWGASLHRVSEMDARYDYFCQGMELVSPVFQYSDRNSFERKIAAVKDAFRGKAFNNETTGLHVHLGIPVASNDPFASGLTLAVLKVIFLLWAASEPVIEDLQPRHRRAGNYQCESLFHKVKKDHTYLTTHHDKFRYLAEQLANCASEQEIIRVVGGTPGQSEKKLNISFETTRKPTTIEFREHCGTLSRNDIPKWIAFCRKMLLFSYQNRDTEWTEEWLENMFTQTASLSLLSNLVGISNNKRDFFRNRREKVAQGYYDRVVVCQ